MIITTSPPYTNWKNSSNLQHQNFDCAYIHIYVYIYNWVYMQVHLLYTIVLEWHIGSHACTFCIDSTESRSSTYVYYIVSFCYFKKKLHLQQFIRHEKWFAQFCSLWKSVEYRELEISTICTSDRYIYNEVKVRFTEQARSIAFESKGGAASPQKKILTGKKN